MLMLRCLKLFFKYDKFFYLVILLSCGFQKGKIQMITTFKDSPIYSYNIGSCVTHYREGTIAGGQKFINESFTTDYKNCKRKEITGLIEKQGDSFPDIYSNFFRRKLKFNSPFGVTERLARNGNNTRTYSINGIRRLKIARKSEKFAGITLYNSKGLKLGSALKKFFKALV